MLYNINMENNNEFQSLSEIISNFSNTSEKLPPRPMPNFFKNTIDKKEIIPHKINHLESEFYAPQNIENVFDENIILEHKISKLNKDLEILNNKIKAEKNFENSEIIAALRIQKNDLEQELHQYQEEYKKISNFTKIKSRIKYYIKFIIRCFKKLNIFTVDYDNSETSKQSIWKKNIQKLNLINDEINEIIKTNTPFGENENRYERLSLSLNKALKLKQNINNNL